MSEQQQVKLTITVPLKKSDEFGIGDYAKVLKKSARKEQFKGAVQEFIQTFKESKAPEVECDAPGGHHSSGSENLSTEEMIEIFIAVVKEDGY